MRLTEVVLRVTERQRKKHKNTKVQGSPAMLNPTAEQPYVKTMIDTSSTTCFVTFWKILPLGK